MKTIVVMGVSGCGKTSIGEGLAERLHRPFLEGDSLHPQSNVEKMARGTPLTDDDRWPWLAAIGARMQHSIAEGKPLIVSCSSLKRSYRDLLREATGNNTVFVFLDGSEDLLTRRMSGREGHFMPVSLLKSQLATLENPTGEPGVVTVSIDQPVSAIIEDATNRLDKLLTGAA
ncbi:gluconokinase [Allorhizobium sp. BGMRC 0089]|uniref:gluconokinase n=1 Tax=Allorhizobium sonneratiae TaxID=2934936 RepID=UPI0020337557|nr:gluconokinase [Allorhizobium sonneratiae]MCM2291343.1 gluconokinase [Allorhizobium sonneratiae]